MNSQISKHGTRRLRLVLTAALVVSAISAGAAATRILDDGRADRIVERGSEPTQAEQRFADAPHGVDPMVTGPSTTGFREQQRAAGCDSAVWPDIPIVCYPG